MLLFLLLAGSLFFTDGQNYTTLVPQSSSTTQRNSLQPYNLTVVSGLRLKAKCVRELNATVAEQVLKQYLSSIPPEYIRLKVKSITKL